MEATWREDEGLLQFGLLHHFYIEVFLKLLINLLQICYMLFNNLLYFVSKCLHDVNIVVITWLHDIHALWISNGILVFMKVSVTEVNTLVGCYNQTLIY